MEGVLHITAVFERPAAHVDVHDRTAAHANSNESHFSGVPSSRF